MRQQNILDSYIKESIQLIHSIVIKVDYIGVQDNLKHIEIHGDKDIDLYDKTSWRYYNNLVGEYHSRNSVIKVTSLDNNMSFVLTKDNIVRHPKTFKELRRYGAYYKELLKRYPNHTLLIDSILNKVNIKAKEVIDVPDGSIISYNKELVADNEYSLIEELNKYSIDYFTRWYNYNYVYTDNLYISSVLQVLYSKLLLKLYSLSATNSLLYEIIVPSGTSITSFAFIFTLFSILSISKVWLGYLFNNSL